MNKRKNDFLLFVVIIIVSFLIFAFQKLRASSGEGAMLTVTYNSEVIFEGRLYDSAAEIIEHADRIDREFVHLEADKIVIRAGDAYNILEPDADDEGSPGIRCVEANCRDRVCIDTGLAVSEEHPIICLPHKLAVRVTRVQ